MEARQAQWKKRSFGVGRTRELHLPSQPGLSFLTWKMGLRTVERKKWGHVLKSQLLGLSSP